MSYKEKEVRENEVLLRIVGRPEDVKVVLARLHEIFGETYPTFPEADRVWINSVRVYAIVCLEEES